ncbi:hypothetical protein FOXYS1_13937 [Fusarium oxysporum]|uniref:Uncharacterized protein n=1 Tax=Fusarium oxysporum TaxID=5507 RepID=A0A8H5A020_FUSOX|nr:hypothetical protein FOXYS1_13937 [Fusarium oxysporum]
MRFLSPCKTISLLLFAKREDELSISEDYDNYADRQQTLLWKAVEAGQEDTARSLLRHDFIRINETDYEGRTLLLLAVGLGHTNIVECLLDRHDIDVNLRDGNHNLPLNEAAGNGHEAISSLLLEKDDIGVNLKDGDKRTPLIKAASNGHGAIVRQLLERDDIDVNLGNDEGDTPLVEAAWNGHGTVVTEGRNIVVGLLLERDDIELNVKTSSDETPLFAAANNGHESVTKLLLSRDGIELNVNCHGDTPLAAALDRGHKVVSELLLYQEGNELEHNGSIDRGYFLLSKALDRGLQDIASKILIAKISRNVEIPIGRSPLSWAAERNKTDQIRSILRIDTLGPNLRDAQGRTPLSRAAECDSISVLDLSKGKITWEGCGVGWSMGKLGQDSGSVRYFSMLQESGIPDDGYELFQQLLAESTSKWLEFCIQFEDHLSHVRLDQLKSQGKRPETISHLAENALHIAQLRRALQGQVRSAEEFNTDLGRLHGSGKDQRAFEYIHTFADIRQQLQILDETIRDLPQFEFAWASINEAHKSSSLAISMKRLSWITSLVIFLPAMFAANVRAFLV